MRKSNIALALASAFMSAATSAEEGSASGGAESAKTTIRPDTSKMVKTANGSFHKDDFIGNKLAGLSVAQVLAIGAELGVDTGKYANLNPGQQRMNVGNTLRRMSANQEVADKIAALADPMHESNAAAKAEAEAAKAEAEAAKAEAKAAKEAAKAAKPKKEKKAKVADSSEGEGEGSEQ